MDQSALLSVVGGMYDRLVQDVSNRVYAMMIETERARQPADYGQLRKSPMRSTWKKRCAKFCAAFDSRAVSLLGPRGPFCFAK